MLPGDQIHADGLSTDQYLSAQHDASDTSSGSLNLRLFSSMILSISYKAVQHNYLDLSHLSD